MRVTIVQDERVMATAFLGVMKSIIGPGVVLTQCSKERRVFTFSAPLVGAPERVLEGLFAFFNDADSDVMVRQTTPAERGLIAQAYLEAGMYSMSVGHIVELEYSVGGEVSRSAWLCADRGWRKVA